MTELCEYKVHLCLHHSSLLPSYHLPPHLDSHREPLCFTYRTFSWFVVVQKAKVPQLQLPWVFAEGPWELIHYDERAFSHFVALEWRSGLACVQLATLHQYISSVMVFRKERKQDTDISLSMFSDKMFKCLVFYIIKADFFNILDVWQSTSSSSITKRCTTAPPVAKN